MGMRILVTGANGFLGQALVKQLAKEHEIIGMHERAPSRPGPYTEIVADLRDREQINKAVMVALPDAVIHLGAKTEVAWSFDDYSDVSLVNYGGTVHLAEAVTRYAPSAHFVFASTMETYGRQPKPWGPFTETTPQNPCAPYAVAKVGAELYLRYLAETRGLRHTILRQTNTYGRVDNEFFVVERIITQMLRGATIRLGDPRPYRNLLHVDDLVWLYELVLSDRNAVGQTFVTGPDNALTIEALVGLIAELIGWEGEVVWNTQAPRPGEVWYLNSDPAKAEKYLGWSPRIGLREGLSRTIEAWR